MPNKKNYQQALHHSIFQTISTAADELNLESYVIGGFVRDFLLERGEPKDIDVVAVGSGIELAKKVSKLLPINQKSRYLKIMVLPC
jgi:poly(A) polymerase